MGHFWWFNTIHNGKCWSRTNSASGRNYHVWNGNPISFITLPVEYDASNRALAWLKNENIVTSNEYKDSEDALKWAARTYVVAAIGSLATLLYFIMIYLGRELITINNYLCPLIDQNDIFIVKPYVYTPLKSPPPMGDLLTPSHRGEVWDGVYLCYILKRSDFSNLTTYGYTNFFYFKLITVNNCYSIFVFF